MNQTTKTIRPCITVTEGYVPLATKLTPKPNLATRDYKAKVRQMAASNTLGNKELYELYNIRKIGMTGAVLKTKINEGMIKFGSSNYVLSWIDCTPSMAMKATEVTISLRSPKFIDCILGKKPVSYAVVTIYQGE